MSRRDRCGWCNESVVRLGFQLLLNKPAQIAICERNQFGSDLRQLHFESVFNIECELYDVEAVEAGVHQFGAGLEMLLHFFSDDRLQFSFDIHALVSRSYVYVSQNWGFLR